jgi:hypothetical protein
MKLSLCGAHRYCQTTCARRDHVFLYRTCWTVDGALITARSGWLRGGDQTASLAGGGFAHHVEGYW